jgi:hypothetical protein
MVVVSPWWWWCRACRGNRAGPWFSKKRFAEDDPRLLYTIERPDYRVLFALSIHSYSSPCLRLYDADNIEVWLNLATEEYISSNVQILPAKDRQVPFHLECMRANRHA